MQSVQPPYSNPATRSSSLPPSLPPLPECHEIRGGALLALQQRLAAGGGDIGRHIVHAVGQPQVDLQRLWRWGVWEQEQ